MKFVPYKENFNTILGAGDSIELVCKTAGQVLYYLNQASEGGLKIEQKETTFGDATYDMRTPAEVKIENKTTKVDHLFCIGHLVSFFKSYFYFFTYLHSYL